MKPFALALLLFAFPAFGAGSCPTPANYDGFREQWQPAAQRFYGLLEELLATEIPSHITIHATMKQLNVFFFARQLKANGCDVKWVRQELKAKTKALKNYLVTSDLSDLAEEERASALQRYHYRRAMARALASADTFQIYAAYYEAKDTAYQGRRTDSARKADDNAAKKVRKAELKDNKKELDEDLKRIYKQYLAELKAERAAEKAKGKTK